MAGAELWSLGHQDMIKVILTYPDFDEPPREGLDEVKIGGASGGKITHIRIVRPFPEGHIVHELRNDPIEVHIALAVGVRGQINGDAIDTRGKVGAMVEIKATQEILIGFPAATVLRHGDAGDDFQDFAWAEHWPGFELCLAHPTLRGRPGNPREIISSAGDDHRFQRE